VTALRRRSAAPFVYLDGKYRLVGKMETHSASPGDPAMSEMKELPIDDARVFLEDPTWMRP
jgi:hypothetical protein